MAEPYQPFEARRCAAAQAVSKTAASEANGLGSTPRRAARHRHKQQILIIVTILLIEDKLSSAEYFSYKEKTNDNIIRKLALFKRIRESIL